jgi:CheY-like chemotaxis protein
MAMLTEKAQTNTEEAFDADVLLYDLDEALRISALLGGRDTPMLLQKDGQRRWPHVRLVIAFSSNSVSRLTLEQLEAVAVLYKPFEMGRLQRYLHILQKLFFPAPDDAFPTTSQLHTATSARILVVDDDSHVADAVRQCLIEETTYQVALAHDGIEALEQYLSWRPHCIVTDLIMPWMNGYQVMHCLKAASLHTLPAFVVMSALIQFEVPPNRSFLKEHVAAYVDKPFNIDQLLAAVEQALHTARVPLPQGQALQNVA